MQAPGTNQADIDVRRQLIARARNGDNQAFLEYYKLNIGLFESTVRRYSKYVDHARRDDLRQEGMLGLMRGIAMYNPNKASDKKPEGYVFAWVRAFVSQYARDNGVGASKGIISENVTVSVEGDDTISLFDCIKDETQDVAAYADDREMTLIMNEAVHKLLPKEKVIVRRRLFSDDPDTLESIGDDLGVSRERIRQIEMDVRIKLRKRLSVRLRDHDSRMVA